MKKPNRTQLTFVAVFFAASFAYVIYYGTRKSEMPGCLVGHIENLKNRAVQNPPASIIHHRYSRGDAYEITADCCDQMSPVLDSSCQEICKTGGLGGAGDGKCPADLTAVGIVWRDTRN